MASSSLGPNCIKIVDEMLNDIKLQCNARILDLGCGTALTSIYLAKKYQATVWAVDLWNDPTDNYERIKTFGLEEKIIPIRGNAVSLPFAKEYFDMLVSVGAYNYFGTDAGFLDLYLAPLAKSGGLIAVSTPGLKEDFKHGVPKELQPYWQADINFFSCD